MTDTFADFRIPVTLLTGFLGSGKTTLLNHLIRDPEAGRVAVIMNEFGDIGLDHDLIEEATEETVLLQSGCLCCSVLGDLAKTLGSLMAKRGAGKVQFDRVVIETSGIADPGPILHTMMVDHLVASTYRMDGVVTLADAAAGHKTLDKQFEAVHQIAMADVVILTKTDLVSARDLARFEGRVRTINGTARQVKADHGRVPTGTLFGLSGLKKDLSRPELDRWLATDAPQPDPLAGLSGFAPKTPKPAGFDMGAAPQARHDHRIASAGITIDTPLPAGVLDVWLDTLIAMRGEDILRMKGIVHVEGMDWPFVLHGVQHIFDSPVPLKSWDKEDTTSRIVLIARDISEADLQASLETLRARPGDDDIAIGGMISHTIDQPF